MEDRERLIGQLDQARQKMRTLIADMDTQMEIYPGWTIKHVLAHITGWDDATIASLRAHIRGEPPSTPATRGIDAYNADSVATREALSYDRIVQEWELAREQLKTLLHEMPPEKLAEPLVFPWGQRGTVAQIVAIMADHEEEHTVEIRELVARSGPR